MCEQSRHPTGLYSRFTRAPQDQIHHGAHRLASMRVACSLVWRGLTLAMTWGKFVRRGLTRTPIFPPTGRRRWL